MRGMAVGDGPRLHWADVPGPASARSTMASQRCHTAPELVILSGEAAIPRRLVIAFTKHSQRHERNSFVPVNLGGSNDGTGADRMESRCARDSNRHSASPSVRRMT
jgi:hypothetical protein